MHVETVNPNSSTSYPEFKLTDERVLGWSYQESDWLYSSYIRYGWAQGYFHGTLNRKTGIVTATDTAYYAAPPVRSLCRSTTPTSRWTSRANGIMTR